MQFLTSPSAVFIFQAPHGSPSKLTEILMALIPNHSVFLNNQTSSTIHTDTYSPRTHNKTLYICLILHSLTLPDSSMSLSCLLTLPLPLSFLQSFSLPHFSFWWYVSVGLFLCNTFHLHHYHQYAARLECARQWHHCNKMCAKLAS